jgi:hypothetical protein
MCRQQHPNRRFDRRLRPDPQRDRSGLSQICEIQRMHPRAGRLSLTSEGARQQPNLYIPSVAGAMIGDMVAVTDAGYEVLTKYPRDLIVY